MAQPTINNRYQLEAELGKGGMGVVHRATDRLTGEAVALKQVLVNSAQLILQGAETHQSSNLRLALGLEFQTLASLRHPNIISVLDYGFDEKRQPFFTMNLLEGAQSLHTASQDAELEDRISLLLQLLQAMTYLHRRGIIHRDIKPSNVLVVDNHVRVLDFGLAVSQEDDQMSGGTLAYMAPELFMNKPADEASDLFAVGVIAYELIFGHYPFDISNKNKLIYEILHAEPSFHAYRKLDHSAPQPTTFTQDPGIGTARTQLDDDEWEDIDHTIVNNVAEAPTMMLGDSDTKGPFDGDTLTQDELSQGGLANDLDVTVGRVSYDTSPAPTQPFSQPTPIDDPVVNVVRRLLAKDPASRYRDAYTVIVDLCAAADYPLPAESLAIRESFIEAAKFVGRKTELEKLIESLTQMLDTEKGVAWLIGGESGVGKSRLMNELRIRAMVHGAVVVRGHLEEDGGLHYQMWRDILPRLILNVDLNDLEAGILKPIIPNIDRLLDRPIPDAPALESRLIQERLIFTIADVIRRQQQPVVLLIDDLQWARESLLPLQHLLDIMDNLPIMLVANYRSDERPHLAEHLPAMQSLQLERLSEAEIAELSASILGEPGQMPALVKLLRRTTEGNVFFLVEVIRALADYAGSLENVSNVTLPKSVLTGGITALIQRRIAKLSQPEQDLLNYAAIIGRHVDIELIRHLAPTSDIDSWLANCQQISVLEIRENQWQFAYNTFPRHLAETIEDKKRKRLHYQVARALEIVYADKIEPYYGDLAQHFAEADYKPEALKYSRLAGHYAAQLYINLEAIKHYTRALDYCDDAHERIELLLARERLNDLLGNRADQQTDLNLAQQHVDMTPIPEDGVEIAIRLGKLAYNQGDYEEAERFYHEAQAIAEKHKLPDQIGNALIQLALNAYRQGDLQKAFDRGVDALQRIPEENKSLEADCLNVMGIIQMAMGDLGAAESSYEEALHLRDALNDKQKLVYSLNDIGVVHAIAGKLDEAGIYFERSLVTCREIGDRQGIATAYTNLGMLASDSGNVELAVQSYEEAVEILREIHDQGYLANTLINLAHASVKLQNLPRTYAYLNEGLQLAYAINATSSVIEGLSVMASVLFLARSFQECVMLIGFIKQHPALTAEIQQTHLDSLMPELKSMLGEATYREYCETGEKAELDQVVKSVLDDLQARTG